MNNPNLLSEWPNIDTNTARGLSQYEYRAVAEAHGVFGKARRQSKLFRLWARVRQTSPRLYSLKEEIGSRPLLLRQLDGVRTVRLAEIRGSEGKSDQFDRSFRPLHDRTRARWISVALARAMGHSLPPVDLIRVGDIYFVRDGHHRVSVARAYGQREIEANVWDLPAAKNPVHVTPTTSPRKQESVPLLTTDTI